MSGRQQNHIRCHVHKCLRWVDYQGILCDHHLYDVGKHDKENLARLYRVGQGVTVRPSIDWFILAREVIEKINKKEKHRRNWNKIAKGYES